MKLVLLLVLVGVVYMNLATGDPVILPKCIKAGSFCAKHIWARKCCNGLQCKREGFVMKCKKPSKCIARGKPCGGKRTCCNKDVCYKRRCRYVSMMPVIGGNRPQLPPPPPPPKCVMPGKPCNGRKCCLGKCTKNKCTWRFKG